MPKAKILVVDDNLSNVKMLRDRLRAAGYEVVEAYDGEEALEKVEEESPDLILLDVMMPKMDGFEVCRRLKDDERTAFIPVVIVTALTDRADRIRGVEAGADDFLTKPVDHTELSVRVKSLLRIKHLYDELAKINETLEQRVQDQVEYIQNLSRLKQYFSPKLAERLISDESIYEVRRKTLTMFFVDIRGSGSLTEMMEPEEFLTMLNEYFTEMTRIIFEWGGTVGRFVGDGIMGYFGDPEECPNHAESAVKMALEMQAKVNLLNKESLVWSDSPLSIGIGINTGYVTIGNVGPENYREYTVLGRHVNLAAYLVQEAKPEQVLIGQGTYSLVADTIKVEELGRISVKGFDRPVLAYNVLGLI